MNEKYVIVCRTYDPVQADMLGDLLRENGIFARVLGTRNGALIGVGQNILQMHIEVPQSQAGEATDFIEAFFQADGDALLREATGFDGDEEDEGHGDGGDPSGQESADTRAGQAVEAQARRTLRPMFAAGLALMASVVGGGHLYGRKPFTACLIAAGHVIALANIMNSEWTVVATGLVMYVTLLALDLAGSQLAVRAYNRGVKASAVRQLVTGALFLLIAGAVAALVGPRIPEPELEDRPTVQAPRHAPQSPSWA